MSFNSGFWAALRRPTVRRTSVTFNHPCTNRAQRCLTSGSLRNHHNTAPPSQPYTIQYNTIQYNTIQYNTIQYNTIQYNTIQYNTYCAYCIAGSCLLAASRWRSRRPESSSGSRVTSLFEYVTRLPAFHLFEPKQKKSNPRSSCLDSRHNLCRDSYAQVCRRRWWERMNDSIARKHAISPIDCVESSSN